MPDDDLWVVHTDVDHRLKRKPERKIPAEVAKARYQKAQQTAAKKAYVEWKLICDKGDFQIYHLRSRGVMRYDRSSTVRGGNKIYHDVMVRPSAVSLVTIEDNTKYYAVIKFKRNRVYGYRYSKIKGKYVGSRGMDGFDVEKKVGEFLSGVVGLAKGRDIYKPMIDRAKVELQEKIRLVAERNGVTWDAEKGILQNFLTINRPIFVATFAGEPNSLMKETVKLFKTDPKKTVKYICGSNTRAVTRLFFTSGQKDGTALFVSKCILSHLVRRFWPIDYVQKIWAAERLVFPATDRDYSKAFKWYRAILSRMQPATLFDYWTAENRRWNELQDTVRMYKQTDGQFELPARIRSITDLHDQLTPAHQRYQHTDYKLKCPKQVEKVDGLKFDDYEIRAPKSHYEMLKWGEVLRNCIGSYAARVKSGDTIILGVFQKGEIKYGIELDRSLIICQFRGRFNEDPPNEERALIESEIGGVLKIVPTSYVDDQNGLVVANFAEAIA